MKLTIDFATESKPLPKFWAGTGFSPAELLLDTDMRQALAYIGSIPNQGIRYVRIHYLLNLVTAEGLGTDAPAYDWAHLDTGLDVLVENKLLPFFELMGNPSGYFTDFTDDTQLHAWRRLVSDLAAHVIERYGQEAVREWYFETWNEPDIPFWKFGDEGFLNYYDACSEGLKAVDPELRFGGPGTAKTLSPLFKKLLAHCDTGTNYFTGETGVRLDFISVHEKGVRNHKEDLTPDSQGITDREAGAIAYIREHHPRFTDTPFMNNECDPQTGWEDIHTWRGKPYYAAIACKIIDQHIRSLIDDMGVNYALLSNDNGFLGKWGQRGLLARFGGNPLARGQAEHETVLEARDDPFEFVKKPVFNAMVALSLLGDRRFPVTSISNEIGCIATQNERGQIAILLYESHDQIMKSRQSSVELDLKGLDTDAYTSAEYDIQAGFGNPFDIWQSLRGGGQHAAPDVPSMAEFSTIREHDELQPVGQITQINISGGSASLSFTSLLPGVKLLLLTPKLDNPPAAPTNLRAKRYKGLTERENIMLTWDGIDTTGLYTYEVLFAESPDSEFTRINGNLLCSAYLHAREPGTSGVYKVRARDYWDRVGPESETMNF